MTSRNATPAGDAIVAIVDMIANRVVEKLEERQVVNGTNEVVYTANGPLIPGKKRSWMLANIKKMPGAYKVGRDWMISATDFDGWRKTEEARRCARGVVKLATAKADNDQPESAIERIEAQGLRRTK